VPLPDLHFAFMATIFLFNSKKKDGKEMPPRKLMSLRDSLRSSALTGTKELAEKDPLRHLLP
jgi:hypothetical protein